MSLQNPPPRTPRAGSQNEKPDPEFTPGAIGGITQDVAEHYAAQPDDGPLHTPQTLADAVDDDLRRRVLRYAEPQACYGDPYGAAQTIRDLVAVIRAKP